MAQFKTYLRDPNKDAETPIIFIIRFNGKELKYPTGKKVHPKFWNKEKQQCRQSQDFIHWKEINGKLTLFMAQY